jgi:hypothetical protein
MKVLRALLVIAAASTATILASAGAHAQSPLGAPLFAVLTGGNECNAVAPPSGPDCRKGDPDGIGSATVILVTTTSLCFAIAVDNLAGATLAHIHRGISSVNGGIMVTLVAPNAPSAGNPGVSSGCVAGLPTSTIAAIRGDPTSFYVNVHNSTYPDGALRGQLH